MSEAHRTRLAWMRTGGWCGLASIGAYLAAAFVPLPDMLAYAAAFAFGPLLALGAIGLYAALSLRKDGPLPQIAALFAVAGGITILIMLAVQQAIFGTMAKMTAALGDPASAEARAAIERVSDGLNSVHFGIDVAWDVLISTAVVLFGLAMWRHPQFGKVFGGLGVVLGLLLLGFNLYYFPVPPASSNSIDWGPFVALWLLVAFGLLLRAQAWAKDRTLGG